MKDKLPGLAVILFVIGSIFLIYYTAYAVHEPEINGSSIESMQDSITEIRQFLSNDYGRLAAFDRGLKRLRLAIPRNIAFGSENVSMESRMLVIIDGMTIDDVINVKRLE